MSASVLRVAGADVETIVELCRGELPNEACGILGGKNGRVESVHPVKSTRPSPSRFAMDPTGQIRAMDEGSRAGRELVGIYHSHPGGPAVPSSVDLEEACWPGTTLPNYPGVVQVIVSLQDCAAPVVKGFAPAAGAYVEVRIVIDQ
jgi:[CysO sulfur-carrier protein]-S-L-cysteine hydrolase